MTLDSMHHTASGSTAVSSGGKGGQRGRPRESVKQSALALIEIKRQRAKR